MFQHGLAPVRQHGRTNKFKKTSMKAARDNVGWAGFSAHAVMLRKHPAWAQVPTLRLAAERKR
ncbi:hypothetical protein CPter291_4115 [Collimonas pratensis]|uniref:Uncharacterized protein n=1 Tax=Collimonas pratensis TaxID=279113 RepID=A0ABM5ZBC4_9BURK|nr:hypothetical protein CPter291_4115 [Collimonas pratensis]